MAGRFFSSSWKRWSQPGLVQRPWKGVIRCERYCEISALGLGTWLRGDTEQVKEVSKMMFWLGSCCLFGTENVRGHTKNNHYGRSLPFPSLLFFSSFLSFPPPFHARLSCLLLPPLPTLPISENLESLIKNSCPLKSLCLQWSPKLFWQRKVTLISVLKTNLWVKITTAYHLAKLFQISLNA